MRFEGIPIANLQENRCGSSHFRQIQLQEFRRFLFPIKRFRIFHGRLDTFTGVEFAAASTTRWGGTLGVGWEYGFAPNWSIGVEYDHLWMGDANNSFTATDERLVNFLNNRITQDVDMVTFRVNYRFGGYGRPATPY